MLGGSVAQIIRGLTARMRRRPFLESPQSMVAPFLNDYTIVQAVAAPIWAEKIEVLKAQASHRRSNSQSFNFQLQTRPIDS